MSEQAYITSVNELILSLKMAIEEAKVLLPQDVVKQHWIAEKHSPTPWDSVHHWYIGKEDWDPHMADIIADIKLMAYALSCLKSAAMSRVERPGSLRLAKVRRMQ